MFPLHDLKTPILYLSLLFLFFNKQDYGVAKFIIYRDNLALRGVQLQTQLCPLCNSAMETTRHLLQECSTSREVVAKLNNWWTDFPARMSDMEDWIDGTRIGDDKSRRGKMVQVLTKACLWGVWNARNQCIFNNKVSGPNEIVRAKSSL